MLSITVKTIVLFLLRSTFHVYIYIKNSECKGQPLGLSGRDGEGEEGWGGLGVTHEMRHAFRAHKCITHPVDQGLSLRKSCTI